MKPVHNCETCGVAGTVPETLLWTFDLPAAAKCFEHRVRTIEELRAEYEDMILNPEHKYKSLWDMARLLECSVRDLARAIGLG